METLDCIFSRRSVRKYTGDDVADEQITRLLEAAMAAPSGKNTQPWEFVVVRDRSVLDAMAKGLPYAKMLQYAPVAVIVCGDETKSSYWYVDCSNAAQNLLLAAEDAGLGAVWTAAYPYQDRMSVCSELLGLPENIKPLCVIPVGHPAVHAEPAKRFDSAKIHLEKY